MNKEEIKKLAWQIIDKARDPEGGSKGTVVSIGFETLQEEIEKAIKSARTNAFEDAMDHINVVTLKNDAAAVDNARKVLRYLRDKDD